MEILTASATAYIVTFGDVIDPAVASQVFSGLEALKGCAGIVEVTPSYTSLYVAFDPLVLDPSTCKALLEETLAKMAVKTEESSHAEVEIPVFYDPEVGLDLEGLAREKGLSMEEIIALHVSPVYRVYAIGFLPGFPYMGTVDPRLAAPRHANPRTALPKGSVGIAENQTAIYPQKSPGGWQILGRTPLELFDPKREGLSLLKAGDRVRFRAISRGEFFDLGGVL